MGGRVLPICSFERSNTKPLKPIRLSVLRFQLIGLNIPNEGDL